jgi:ATP-dependent Clp protease ATP-binding subunit ClpA
LVQFICRIAIFRAASFPIKAVSVLDTTCARVALSQTAIPPAVEDCRRQIDQLEGEIAVMKREEAAAEHNAELLCRRRAELERTKWELATLESRWEEERRLVALVVEYRKRLEEIPAAEDAEQLREQLARVTSELESAQGGRLLHALRPELVRVFKPALLGRLTVVPYRPIGHIALRRIVQLKLEKISRRLWESHHVTMEYPTTVVEEVARR